MPRIRPERLVLPLCFVAYTCSYLCRTNYSVALPHIASAFALSRPMSGLIGTAYFWMYAIGQLINGALSERFDPKRFVAVGLFLAAACNVAIGFATGPIAILALWGLNGYCLSMLWCAMVRILTAWYRGEAYKRASFIISLPTTIGYIINWGTLGALLAVMDWRWAFFLPAMVTFLFLLAWIFLPRRPAEAAEGAPASAPPARTGMWRIVRTPFFLSVAALSIAQGLIKESVNLWSPTILEQVSGDPRTATALSLIVPIAGTAGILATSVLIRRVHKAGDVLLLLLMASLASAVVLWVAPNSATASVAMLGILLATMSGNNTIITGILPLRYLDIGRCAQMSGLFNFIVYVGAALGGVASGAASAAMGWAGTYALWGVLIAVSLGAALWRRTELNSI